MLLLPTSSLFASVDVLYLLPLRDEVRSRALEPATMLRTPLTSVSTHSPTPLASHHLLTVVISCILLQVIGEHCGTCIKFCWHSHVRSACACARAVYLYAFLRISIVRICEKKPR